MLFVKDPQRLVKDHLEEHGGGGVTRVLGVSKLMKRYGTHELRRELMHSYDRFLVDKRVAPMMVKLLGSKFIKSCKMPVAVNFSNDITAAIKRALSSTQYTASRGTVVSVCYSSHSLNPTQMADNVRDVIDSVLRKIDGGPANILSINLKSDHSREYPIYVSLPDVMTDPTPPPEPVTEPVAKTPPVGNKKERIAAVLETIREGLDKKKKDKPENAASNQKEDDKQEIPVKAKSGDAQVDKATPQKTPTKRKSAVKPITRKSKVADAEGDTKDDETDVPTRSKKSPGNRTKVAKVIKRKTKVAGEGSNKSDAGNKENSQTKRKTVQKPKKIIAKKKAASAVLSDQNTSWS